MILEDDPRFIERLKARDELAFNELVRHQGPRIQRMLSRMVGRPAEAEELAQETFVQVFKYLDQFRGECKLSTWVYRIAVNLCKNRIQYLARRHDLQQVAYDSTGAREEAHHDGTTVAEVARPDHSFEGLELQRIVQECLAELEPDHREILVLRDIEELSYEEVGEVTGLGEGTVKSRLHRARSALKRAVELRWGENVR